MEIATGYRGIKIPPNDINVEAALLGSMLVNNSNFSEVHSILPKEALYTPKHRIIYTIMEEIYNARDSIDVVTVISRLKAIDELEKIGGRDYLAELVSNAPSTMNVESYASLIKEKYIRRELISAGGSIADLGFEEGKKLELVVDTAEKLLFNITHHHIDVGFQPISKMLPDIVDEIIHASASSDELRGVSTGFSDLDTMLSGLQKSDLIILAARPSLGKTTLALDIARHVALREELPVGIFSLEMSNSQLIERMLSAESKIHAWKLRTGSLKGDDALTNLTEAADKLSKSNIFIDDTPSIPVLTLRSTARRMKKDHNIQLLIIDYLQLVSPSETRRSDSVVQQITEISKTLKQVARELEIPVVALSQLSRDIEKRGATKPRLSDLRDSGSIEQDADVVMFLHRENPENAEPNKSEEISIFIEKHRNGPTGKTRLIFDKQHVTFIDRARDSYSDFHEYE